MDPRNTPGYRLHRALTNLNRIEATGLTLDEIIADYLDYLHHEAFYVVSPTFEVTAYRTLWFGLQYDSETVDRDEPVGNGALATVR